MFRKIILFSALLFSVSFAYQGSLHKAFPMIVPAYMDSAGFKWEADTVEKYMDLLSRGAADPDNDHPDFIIPDSLLPSWAKAAGGTSIAKWEHCLLDDCSPELEKALSKVCEAKGFKYQYADSCAVQWLNKAEVFWKAGQVDSAMWHLGRTCHLIEDITVPMHTHLKTNLLEAWRVINHQEPNQEIFENNCNKWYIAGGREWNLKEQFDIPATMYGIASDSRKRFKYCDGIGSGGIWNHFPLNWIFPCMVEDQPKAADESLTASEINTVKLIHYFLQRVSVTVK